ncbi:MAG: DNRLRE domain-containing protein [Candidatus Ornithomonoglobus sp.]
MNKTKRLLSLFTSVAMAASAFSAIVIPASAAETVETIEASAATYINSASADTNFSDAGVVYANYAKPNGTGWASTGGDGMDVALVQFDVSEYVGSIIDAQIKLTATCTTAGKNSEVNVAYTDSGWDASTITWNTAQEMNPVKIAALGYADSSGTALSGDVSDYVLASEDGILSFAFYTSTGRQQSLTDIKLDLTVTDSKPTTYSVNYVDTEGNVIKEAVVKDGFADVEYTAETSDTDNFYIGDDYYVYQPELSTTTCTAAEDGSAGMTLVYKKLVGAILVESFGSSDVWGFTTGSGVTAENGMLNLCTANNSAKTDTKAFDEAVSGLPAAHMSFKWKTTVELANTSGGRQSEFRIEDKEGNIIFTISGASNRSGIPTQIRYAVGGDVTTSSEQLAVTNDWFTIDLNMDFINKTVSGTITTGTTVVTIPETAVNASGLAVLAAQNISSLAPMAIDDVIITKGDVKTVTFNVISSEGNSPIADAVVNVGGFTAVTDADGKAVMDIPSGTFTAEIVAAQHRNNSAEFTVADADITVPVTMEYVGVTAATKVVISGGDDGIYKPASGEAKTKIPYTAVVYDTIDQAMPDETVTWSIDNIATGLTGVSIDQDGIVTVTSDMPIVDNNGDELIIRAACTSNPEVYTTVKLHVYNVAAVTVFDVVGPAVIKDGATAVYSVTNVKDQYGVEMETSETPVITCDNSSIAIDGLNVTPQTGVTNEIKATLTVTLGGVSETYDVTVYGYDFYEPGTVTASCGNPRMEEINGVSTIVWPASSATSTATYTMEFPEAVELAGGTSKMMTFNTCSYDTSGAGKDVTAQERTMLIKNSEGTVLMTFAFQNNRMYLSPVFASGAVNTCEHDWALLSENNVNSETIVFATDVAGVTKATIQVNGGETYTFTVGENVGDIASVSLVEGKGAPSARLQGFYNIKITDSDIVPVEISGDSYISKVYGGVATKKYTGSIFALDEGETFTWSVEPVSGDAISAAEDTTAAKAVLTAAETGTATVVKAVYDTNGKLTNVEIGVTIEVTAGESYDIAAPAGTKVMLWNAVDGAAGMKPMANAATAAEVTVPDAPTDKPTDKPTDTPTEKPPVPPAGDITIDQNGVLSVPDGTTATAVIVKYASNINADKFATKTVTINDYAAVKAFDIDGPAAVSTGDSGTFSAVNVIDEHGDTIPNMPVSFALTSGGDIASIDAETGVLTTTASGNVTVAVTVGNPGKTMTLTKDVLVAQFYYIDNNVSASSVEVDVTEIANYTADTVYNVTTANNGVQVNNYTTTASGGKITVDTSGATAVEVSPVYSYEFSTPVDYYEIPLADGNYDITVLKNNNERADVMLAGNIIMQNLDMNGSGRAGLTEFTAVDCKVSGGSAVLTTGGYQSASKPSYISKLTVKKVPSIVTRKQHVYVLGDSLVSTYYGNPSSIGGDGNASPGTAQTGWGQVIDKFIDTENVNVTNLAESGNYAQGLYDSVFKTVLANAEPGDVLLFECGYNDRNYPTSITSESARYENMQNYMELAYNEATEKGIKIVFVTPNISTHGTGWKQSVQGTGSVIAKCEALGCEYIDLSGLSWQYATDKYITPLGEEAAKTFWAANMNISDSLHSTYLGAMIMANIVANAMADMESVQNVIDTSASYTLYDTNGAEIELNIQ